MDRNANSIFAVLAAEHELGLRAFVRACVPDEHAVEDVIQETVIAAWQQLDEYDRQRSFAAWLRGIAKHKSMAHCRAAAISYKHVRLLSSAEIDAIEAEFAPLTSGSPDAFAARLQYLRECLDLLDSQDQQIVSKHYRLRKTCKAIATEISEGVEFVKKRLQRARHELRDCIRGKIDLEAGGD